MKDFRLSVVSGQFVLKISLLRKCVNENEGFSYQFTAISHQQSVNVATGRSLLQKNL